MSTLIERFLMVCIVCAVVAVVAIEGRTLAGRLVGQGSIPLEGASDRVGIVPELGVGWYEIPVRDTRVVARVEKRVEEGIIPTVVVISSRIPDSMHSEYVDEMVAGMQHTVPGLELTRDATSSASGLYRRELAGSYQGSDRRVDFMQVVLARGTWIYTITGSFGGETDERSRGELKDIVAAMTYRLQDRELARGSESVPE
jgi:hypothetical protein